MDFRPSGVNILISVSLVRITRRSCIRRSLADPATDISQIQDRSGSLADKLAVSGERQPRGASLCLPSERKYALASPSDAQFLVGDESVLIVCDNAPSFPVDAFFLLDQIQTLVIDPNIERRHVRLTCRLKDLSVALLFGSLKFASIFFAHMWETSHGFINSSHISFYRETHYPVSRYYANDSLVRSIKLKCSFKWRYSFFVSCVR